MDSFDLAKDYFLSGLDFLEKKEFDKAEETLERSLELIPDRVSTLTNLAAVKIKLEKYEEAIYLAKKVLVLDMHGHEAFLILGVIEVQKRKLLIAIEYFDRALQINHEYVEALQNKGLALAGLQQYKEALNCYDKVLKMNPFNSETLINKGIALCSLTNYLDALDCFNKAIDSESNSAKAWFHKGATLSELKHFDKALLAYETAYRIDPDIDLLLGNLIQAKLLNLDWDNLESDIQLLIQKIQFGKLACPPFGFLSIVDSPSLQMECAKTWVKNEFPSNPELGLAPLAVSNKIHIGYFSADFRDHAVTYLTAELFEMHNRDKFEISAFSLNKISASEAIQNRLTNCFDHFYEVDEMTDLEIAQFSRSLGIHVAVDLGGHTQFSRFGIFSYRAAPIQINFLGHPGTSGAEYIDYIVADKNLIPDPNLFTEKIIYLPNCFQPNDSKKPLPKIKFSRESLGLPCSGFIFCCFNSPHKINLPIFNSWLRILKNTENSYLWLLSRGPDIDAILKNKLAEQGLKAARILFGKNLPYGDYLKRFEFADLFLDTLPFNAGTTATDALWSGLPLLTCEGHSFAGRMASSILKTLDLSELITHSELEYINLAIKLATNPSDLLKIKEKLNIQRSKSPLFDLRLFVEDLEKAYELICRRKCMNLKNESVSVAHG